MSERGCRVTLTGDFSLFLEGVDAVLVFEGNVCWLQFLMHFSCCKDQFIAAAVLVQAVNVTW